MELPKGVIIDGGPQPAAAEQKAKAHYSNFEEWLLSAKYEHMSSSCVDSAAYDITQGRLNVRFKGGGGKWYQVSVEKAQQFYNAPSKMGWIWSNCLVRGPGHRGETKVPSGEL